MTKPTIHGDLAAVVHLEGDRPGEQACWGVIKRTYRVGPGGLTPIEPEPLRHDVRDEDVAVTLPSGSDYRPFKALADVVVLGKAFAPGGAPIAERDVAIEVGEFAKRVHVLGDRVVTWSGDGTPIFSRPAPFTEMPLDYTRAYGGVDERLQPPPAKTFWDALRNAGDPVGAYPRNRVGKGYVAVAARVGDLALPNLEDPAHRLTPENLIARRPERWFEQPLPWALGWMPPSCFPRPSLLGAELRFPVDPDHRLEEVRRGLLPERWTELPARQFHQEASLGMSFHDLKPGTPIRVRGMHPERPELELTLPEPPRVGLEVEGDREVVPARITQVVLTPHELQVEVTWAVERRALPRTFLPGIHGVIPITLWVDGRAIPYEAPPAAGQVLAQARRDGKLAPTGMRLPGVDSQDAATLGQPGQLARDAVPHAHAPRFGPIDPAAGRLLLRARDWTFGRFVFERHYSSSVGARRGALGAGWSHCLEQTVWRRGRWLVHRMSDGTQLRLTLPEGRPLTPGQQLHHAQTGVTVRRITPDRYDVLHADGARYSFGSVHEVLSEDTELARLSEIWRHDGTSLSLRYDGRGLLERLELGETPLARFEHDDQRRLTRVFAKARDGRGWATVASYRFTSSGRLVEARDGRGRALEYRYRGDLLTEELYRPSSGAGSHRRFEYEGATSRARCVAVTEGEARREVSFDAGARVVGFYSPTGASFSGVTDRNHAFTVLRDVFANTAARVYDETSGQLVSHSEGDEQTTFLRDSADQLVEIEAPARGRVALDHDRDLRLVRHVDADGAAATWSYTVDGRITSAVDRAGGSVLFNQALDGPMTSLRTPLEAEITLRRHAATGQVDRVRSPLGERRARYDAQQRIGEIVDEAGATTAFRYDPAGRLCRVQSPAGLVTSYDSDRDSRVLERDDGDVRVTFERDARGRLTQRAEHGLGPQLHRDDEGRVSVFQSEAFDLWEFKRDAAGRVIEELGFNGEVRYARRDRRGLVIKAMRGKSHTTVTRDAAGRPLELKHHRGGLQRYAYSPQGRMTRAQDADLILSFSRDAVGRVLLERWGDAWVRSGYGAGGRVSVDSAEGLALRMQYDVLGSTTSLVATRGPHRLQLRFERDVLGREVRRVVSEKLAVHTTRDPDGRVLERAIVRDGSTRSATGYAWAGVDRMTHLFDPARGRRVHTHDPRGRLVRVGASVRALDDVGAAFRTEARDDHRYAAGGRLLDGYGTEYTYDGRGHRVGQKNALGEERTYRWDGLGRLVSVALSDEARVTYAYDAVGRLTRRRREVRLSMPGIAQPVWEAQHEMRFVWDGLTLLHEVSGGPDGGEITSWIWSGGDLAGMLTAAGAFLILTEPNGAPTEVLDTEGRTVWRGSVDMFGAATVDVEEIKVPWRFAGHWQDPDTGLLHSWLRVYDPETGGYLSPNPLGVIAGSNLYGYLPDPLSRRSPLGLGRGYRTLGGEVRSERLEAELIGRWIEALDRGDGAAGPPEIHDPAAARCRLPDPEAFLFGPWDRYRPSRLAPPAPIEFTRLPGHLGLGAPS